MCFKTKTGRKVVLVNSRVQCKGLYTVLNKIFTNYLFYHNLKNTKTTTKPPKKTTTTTTTKTTKKHKQTNKKTMKQNNNKRFCISKHTYILHNEFVINFRMNQYVHP